jgi:hypothetical protein
LKDFHLRWVLYALSINQNGKRVSYSKFFLTALMEWKASGFQRIVTGDESGFSLYYPGDSVWAASHDELPRRIKQGIDTESAEFRSFGRLTESTLFLMWPKGQHTMYSTELFTNVAIPSLIENVRSRTHEKILKDWLIHMHNARNHNSSRAQRCIEASRAESPQHPASIPDLAPSDFFLFG